MNNIKHILNNSTLVEKLNGGYSNESLVIEYSKTKYVYSKSLVTDNEFIDYHKKDKVLKILGNKNYVQKLVTSNISTNEFIYTYYQSSEYQNLNKETFELYKDELLRCVKNIHTTQIEDIGFFDIVKDTYEYFNICKNNNYHVDELLIKEFDNLCSKDYYFGEKVFSHCDMSPSNVLYNEKNNHLVMIDFEYSNYSYEIFDIVYFAQYCKLDDDQKRYLYTNFNENIDINNYYILGDMVNILEMSWYLAQHATTNDNMYIDYYNKIFKEWKNENSL